MNEHIAKQFDIDLTNIHTKVLQMGGLVEKQIVDAMAALEHGDLALVAGLETEVGRLVHASTPRSCGLGAQLRLTLASVSTASTCSCRCP